MALVEEAVAEATSASVGETLAAAKAVMSMGTSDGRQLHRYSSARRLTARNIVHCLHAATVLVNRLKREKDIVAREAILNSLVRTNYSSTAIRMAECLRGEDAALRNEIINGLRQWSREVPLVLRFVLACDDPDVRIFVVNILNSERHSQVESALIEVIERDTRASICSAAVDLLYEVGSEKAGSSLIRLKVRFVDDAYVQFSADMTLRRIFPEGPYSLNRLDCFGQLAYHQPASFGESQLAGRY